MKKIFFLLLALDFSSCTKDRNLIPDPVEPPPIGFTEGVPGIIKLNEFVANGSVNLNEYGNAEDWIELYNTTNSTLKLEAGKWFITDNAETSPRLYPLPEITLDKNEHILIWCDDLNEVANEIHTNFKLSSSGEKLGLFYDNNGADIVIDTYTFSAQDDGKSLGRSPDGSDNWVIYDVPTPGESNP